MMLNFKVVWVKLLVPFLDLHSCESLIQDGHRKICESNKLEEIRKARKEIAEYENSKNSSSAKESFNKFYTTTEVLDRISQRKINLLITGIKFTKALSISSGTKTKVWYPMPKPWIKIACENGILINRGISTIMYLIIKVALYFKASREIFVVNSSSSSFQKSEYFQDQQWLNNKIVVVGENPYTTQSEGANHHELENFGNWLKKSLGLAKTLKFNSFEQQNISEWVLAQVGEHEIEVSLVKRLIILTQALRLFYLRKLRIGLSLYLFLSYSEIVSVLRVLDLVTQPPGKIVIFNNSHGISKPLWANLYQRKGARVCLVFYSAEDEPLFLSGSVATNDFWQLSRWEEYWVIDDTQRKNILNLLGDHKMNLYVVGVPWWSDNGKPLEITESKSVAFFDFEPHIGHFGLTTYNSYGYQDPKQCAELVERIVAECAKMGIMVWHKPKREIGSRRHSQYADMLQVLLQKYPHNYRLMPSQISPSRLIRESAGCISVAFTSTAIIARDLGIPSVYFSNSNRMPGNHSRESSIPFMNSADELRTWLTKEVISLS